MSSFPAPLTSPQVTALRTSGYFQRAFVCLNTPDVLFRAQASQAITTEPFIQFTYDTVSVGAYTAVWEGMVCYISSTTSLRDAKYRGRVRLAPTSGIFYIDRNATVLNDNDYIIVVRDTDLFSQERLDTLMDSAITYRDLPPVLSGLPSSVVLYDANADGTVTYTTTQVGVPVDAAASSISTWAWSISGVGTSSISNAAIQNPTLTFQAGYHYLIRVIYIDDNGGMNYQISHVYAVTRTFSAPVVHGVLAGTVKATLEDGWSGTLTAYADVSTLLDRTQCTVFSLEHFGDGTSAPLTSNILLTGRVRSDSIQVDSTAETGPEAQVTFQVEGFTSYLRLLRMPSDIIRATSAPNEWGEITAPNPWRMAVYMLWAYTNLTKLCSLGVESGAFTAWQIGGEPRGIDGGFTMDVLINILEPIRAAVNFAPDGSLYFARTVSYLIDRSSVPLVATITQQDLLSHSIDRDSSRTTSQVVAFGGRYNATSNTWDVFSAQAPSIIYLEGEVKEITREILTTDSTIDEAADELKERASNHYGYENAKDRWQAELYDSWAGLMIPTNYQRWAGVLPATSNPLGVAYTGTDYWQLQSADLSLNPEGTVSVSPEWAQETFFDDAQKLGALLPNNLSNMNNVLPVLPNDPAFPTDPLENYPTDEPELEELQPIDPFSGMMSETPFPPDAAADMAGNLPRPGCKVLAVNFRNSTNRESSWTTVSNRDYQMTLSGSAKTTNYLQCADFKVGESGWEPVTDLAKYFAGAGWGPEEVEITPPPGPWYFRLQRDKSGPSFTYDQMHIYWNQSVTDMQVRLTSTTLFTGSGSEFHLTEDNAPDLFPLLQFPAGPTLIITFANAGPVAEGLRLEKVCLKVQDEDDIFVDAFYQWNEDEDGNPINVELLEEGLYIDNSKYDPTTVPNAVPFPPFNPSHRYDGLPFEGTGNPFFARVVLDSYVDVQSAYLNIEVCPKRSAP